MAGENLVRNREAEEFLVKHKNRFAGYLVFHPLYADEMLPELDGFFKRGFFVGFKLLAEYWRIPMTDPRYQPVWEYADRHRLPILMHTWGAPLVRPPCYSDIVKISQWRSSYSGIPAAVAVGVSQRNPWRWKIPMCIWNFAAASPTPRPFETSLQLVGRERVLFGSDTDVHDEAWELGRYLSMPLPDKSIQG